MPELPEVETIRRDLEEDITGHQITKVEVKKPKMVKVRFSGFLLFRGHVIHLLFQL